MNSSPQQPVEESPSNQKEWLSKRTEKAEQQRAMLQELKGSIDRCYVVIMKILESQASLQKHVEEIERGYTETKTRIDGLLKSSSFT